jgi:hypothetical protein
MIIALGVSHQNDRGDAPAEHHSFFAQRGSRRSKIASSKRGCDEEFLRGPR